MQYDNSRRILKSTVSKKLTPILKEYNVDANLYIVGDILALCIDQGPIDFIGNYTEIYKQRQLISTLAGGNSFRYVDHFDYPGDTYLSNRCNFNIDRNFSGLAREFLTKVRTLVDDMWRPYPNETWGPALNIFIGDEAHPYRFVPNKELA